MEDLSITISYTWGALTFPVNFIFAVMNKCPG